MLRNKINMSKPLRIAIIACRKARTQNLCPGDAKCLVCLMKREGEFERYKGRDVQIVGIIDCGDCPGTGVIPSLGLLKMHLASLGETVDVVHIGTCVLAICPYKDELVKRVKEKAGVEVIEGTHKYVPLKLFP